MLILNEACRATLSQSEIRFNKPIAYTDRTMNKTIAEEYSSITENKFVTLVWAMKNFKPCVLMVRRFMLVTDHRSFTKLFKIKYLGSILMHKTYYICKT